MISSIWSEDHLKTMCHTFEVTKLSYLYFKFFFLCRLYHITILYSNDVNFLKQKISILPIIRKCHLDCFRFDILRNYPNSPQSPYLFSIQISCDNSLQKSKKRRNSSLNVNHKSTCKK